MTIVSLADWLASRWIVAHEASREEIGDLFALVDRDLKDAAVPQLSADWRLGISYNAALQLATLALAAEGYRPGRERAHERAILSLRDTAGIAGEVVDVLDTVRRKRNQMNYERAGTTSEAEAEEFYKTVTSLRTTVVSWLNCMTELIWEGKYNDRGRKAAPPRIALPFQTVETVNESAADRDRNQDLFASGQGNCGVGCDVAMLRTASRSAPLAIT